MKGVGGREESPKYALLHSVSGRKTPEISGKRGSGALLLSWSTILKSKHQGKPAREKNLSPVTCVTGEVGAGKAGPHPSHDKRGHSEPGVEG